MRKSPDVNELIRLAPGFAQSVRYDLLFFQGVLQGVASDSSIPATVRKTLEEISGRLGNIAQGARQFIQITDTDYKVAINTRDRIREMESLLRRLSGPHKLQMDVADDLWPIQAVSEMWFEEMLVYLVTNARNAIRDLGTVLIRARNVTEGKSGANPDGKDSVAECVSIEVIDSGVGIAKDIVGRIFEPFISVSGNPGSVTLASINFVVKKLGGRTDVESEIGKGTAVNVTLPRFPEEE